MKLTTLFVLIVLLVVACKKDQLEPLPPEITPVPTAKEFIIVGDSVSNNVDFRHLSPHISLVGFNQTDFYDFYLDSDGIPDFRLKIGSAYPFAGTWFNGCGVNIKCLNPDAEVSIDPLHVDSLRKYPLQYSINDTLYQESTWRTGEFLISANGDVPNDGCYGPGCPNQSYGMWFGTTEKYIGVRINKNLPTLGWFKISLPSTNVNYGQTLVIEQVGYVP